MVNFGRERTEKDRFCTDPTENDQKSNDEGVHTRRRPCAHKAKIVREGEYVVLLGEYRYGVDAKGRLFIPAPLRDELGETLVLAKSFETCLNVYSLSAWEEFCDRLSALPEMSGGDILRYVFSTAQQVVCDSHGRVVIPQSLRQYAALESEAVIIGVRNRAEIWSASGYEAYMNGLDRAAMLETLKQHGF